MFAVILNGIAANLVFIQTKTNHVINFMTSGRCVLPTLSALFLNAVSVYLTH